MRCVDVMWFLWCVLVLNAAEITHGRSSGYPGYTHYPQMVTMLEQLAQQNPGIARTFVLGHSVQGRKLIGVRLTHFASLKEGARPQFRYIANMHGNEIVGRELLLRFAADLVQQWHVNDARVHALLRHTDVWLLPSMNPDGFELGRRTNARGIDLNRNFPDHLRGTPANMQPETLAVMQWSHEQHFVLSANLHGGALVANYPWDGNSGHHSGVYTSTVDDLLFRHLARVYANSHHKMHASRQFPGGITNGAAWYVLYHGLQDYNYAYTSDMGLTLELSNIKAPSASTLPTYWADNAHALLTLAEEVHIGVWGQVRNARGPLANVTIDVQEVPRTVRTNAQGYYWRLLMPGVYHVRAKVCPWHTVHIPSDQTVGVRLDFVL